MTNKVHIVRLLIVFTVLLVPKLSFPQNEGIQFEHISIKEGLSASRKSYAALRDAFLRAMRATSDIGSIEALMDALQSSKEDYYSVQKIVSETLGNLGDDRVVPALMASSIAMFDSEIKNIDSNFSNFTARYPDVTSVIEIFPRVSSFLRTGIF